MIVVWNVDGIKVSHESKKIFTRMAKWLSNTYKRSFEDGSGKMKISRGNIHEHLGMTMDSSEPRVVNITMIPYIEGMVKDFTNHDGTTKSSETPESGHLFKTKEDTIVLEETQSNIYHFFFQVTVCHQDIKTGNTHRNSIYKHASKSLIQIRLKESRPYD